MTSTQEFSCIFCNENFENKEELQVHFRKHADPKFNENVKTKSRFQNEIQTSDGKSNDNMVSCDVCSEVFPTISKAITHKHKVHPDHDTKYFCPWCGKLFTLKHLYDKHIQTNHESAKKIESRDLHCDMCNVNFYVVSAMLYHNKFFHRQDTDLPAVGHSKKQKLIFQELLPMYYCPFCGEEYNNKVNLHKHIGDDHIDENQSPDEVLRCPLCEAILYHLDAYELHLTFHTSDDIYSKTNELNTTELIEFSLETVPPIMEKVENCELGDDVESAINTMGIENFLQLAIDESVDNDNLNAEQASEKVKSKKHKKHKKSKKSAITLDEFLNMNKDVFGEGIDIQGVEEVPTKLVTKQLKNKKQAQTQKLKKVSSAKDLEKLRKQGITIKVNPAKKPLAQTIKIGSKIAIAKPIKIANPSISNKPTTQTMPNSISASNEVLSKLINQSNNQIKVIKKSSQEAVILEQHDKTPNPTVSMADIIDKDENPISPKNVEVQDTSQIKYNTFDMEMEGKNEEKNEQVSNTQVNTSDKVNPNDEDNHDKYQETKARYNCTESEIPENSNKNELLHEDSDASDNDESVANKKSHSNNQCVYKADEFAEPKQIENKNLNDSLKKIINQHITVKSVNQENDKANNKLCLEKDNTQINKDEYIDNSDDNEMEENISRLGENSKKSTENLSAATSLNSFKYLGNLTIKPVQNKTVVGEIQNSDDDKLVENQTDTPQELQKSESIDETIQPHETRSFGNEVISKNKIPEEQKETSKSLDALKNLSKHITIKSLTTQPQNKIIDEKSNDDYTDDENNIEEQEENSNDSMNNSDIKLNSLKIVNTERQPQSITPLVKIKNNTSITKIIESETSANGQDIMRKHASTNILKNLKNVTAKPIVKQNNLGSLSYSTDAIKRESAQKCVKTEKIDEEIEVFNIDDSDSDEVEKPVQSQERYKPSQIIQKNADHKNNKSTHILKNINNQVTVKSATQPTQMHRVIRQDTSYKCSNVTENYSDGNKIVTKEHSQRSTKQDLVIKKALQNLGEHITIKSRNSSPNTSVQYQNTQNSDDDLQTDVLENDDTNSCSNRIKITEINEDECETDDDIPLKQLNDNTSKAIVQSPDESCSDHEDNYTQECDEQLSDIESQIKVNTLNKPNQNLNSNKQSLHLDALKNISKNITVKSLNDKNTDNCNIKVQNRIKKIHSEVANNPTTSGRLANAPFKQKVCQDDSDSVSLPHKIQQTNSLDAENCVNQSAMNQKVSTLANETTDTVNKEVIVKTFQTKTVIQEITTTVTKTIKTLNQTMQHAVRSSIQSTSAPGIRMPKNVQIRPQQQGKNFQGITIRHASPMQPRIRNAMPQRPVVRTPVRPSNQLALVRPSNQLVPIRPQLNQTRTTAPKTLQKKVTSLQSNQQIPISGKPIRIRPSVSSPTMKRPAPEETTGHFSCFKKPKESLIPVSDVPTFSSDKESESIVQFTSVSRMSSSNFNSTTKSVKGNSVVTSVQKSESSTSSQQQVNRLGNMSGLKVMKTSQVKQTSQVEEKCEISASKRTTLEALEKLQKQGLLVKKPRIETDEYNEECADVKREDET